MKELKISLILISFLLFNNLALAWGPTGHRVVGEIAENNISKITKKKIEELVGKESLASLSTWADEIKSDPDKYKHTFSWHYTDWPDHQKSYQKEKNSGSLVRSIEDQISILKNKKKSNDEKRFALKFLIHLVGDLHQPLHVGKGNDRGGNRCDVFFHKEKTNLHRLWDEDMINFTKLSFSELTKFIVDTHQGKTKVTTKSSITEWAAESKNLRLDIYPDDKFSSKEQAIPSFCKKAHVLKDEQLPQLSYQYSYKFFPIIEKRLYLAGVRLAYLLDNVF